MLPLAGTMLAFACSTAPPPETGEGGAVLFRGGQILDGTGNPWYRGDVLVVGDRIARVGVIPAAEIPADAREVDASGLNVMPGFIDPHSHAGPGLATPELRVGEPVIPAGDHDRDGESRRGWRR